MRLPANVPVRVRGDAVFGSVEAFDREASGIGGDLDYRMPAYDAATKHIELSVSAAFGSAEVLR